MASAWSSRFLQGELGCERAELLWSCVSPKELTSDLVAAHRQVTNVIEVDPGSGRLVFDVKSDGHTFDNEVS